MNSFVRLEECWPKPHEVTWRIIQRLASHDPRIFRPVVYQSQLDIFGFAGIIAARSEEHTSELQSRLHLVCRLLLEKKKQQTLMLMHKNTYILPHRCCCTCD